MMVDSQISLSVIVVNWNVAELLRECLRSVIEHTRIPRHDYEIIVVDNASSDGSVDMLRSEFGELELVFSEANLGFAGGCNLGFERARGRFILLLNPDTLLRDDAIGQMLARMEEDPELGILGGRMVDEQGVFRNDSGGGFPTLANLAWNYWFLNRLLPESWSPQPHFMDRDCREVRRLDWVSGADMLIRRAALDGRLLDEEYFMFGEDMELCSRVARAGWQVRYDGRITIVHHRGRSFAKQRAPEVVQMIHKGPRLFFKKTRSRAALVAYDGIMLLAFSVRWLAFTFASLFGGGSESREKARFAAQYVAVIGGMMIGSNPGKDS